MSATAEEMADRAMRSYESRGERAALRCALGDAAALCDALATKIGHEHRVRGGKISKEGRRLAEIATRCGNEIWAMRDLIQAALRPEPTP